ncbi:MAG: diguanylate cyclase [Acholeplasma sp.]|nr:diguanylate cyclase [Acholeplasma sp.]
MQLFYQVDINFSSAFILLLVAVVAFARLNRKDELSKAYLFTAIVIIFQLVFEALTVLFEGYNEPVWIFIRTALSFTLFLIGPFLSLTWYLLLKKMFTPRATSSLASKIVLFLPQASNVLLVLSTLFYKTIFYIDGAGVYHRGNLFFLSMIFSYYYLALTFLMIVSNRKRVVKEDIVLLAIASSLPIIGGLLQIVFYGVLFIWPSVAFALILLYLFLQQRIIHHDFLTNAWTRESFFQFISHNLENYTKKPFGVIYFDLDNLKTINDKYGHSSGDDALKKAVEIVKSSLDEQAIVARLGGDEFVSIFSATSQTDVQNCVNRIRYNLDQWNQQKDLMFKVQLSIGYGLFEETKKEFESFINKLDYKMYQDKRSKEDN